ncbi:hypothetical protein CASFOL_041093 [Castilleja foliolosa]|uniref:Uncharacterized protein n=1 Tax=Castilleja foliolosa TaxID=1961234 RepID=A0ABD3BDN9_9LAMI
MPRRKVNSGALKPLNCRLRRGQEGFQSDAVTHSAVAPQSKEVTHSASAMTKNRLLLCTLLVLLSIIISIRANRLEDQVMDNDNSHVDRLADQDLNSVNSRIDFYLDCFRLSERYRFSDKYDSWQDEMGVNVCRTGLGVMQSMYENTGRLMPGYKEALLIWHNNNQTMVDIDICRCDHRRCPEELQKTAFNFEWDE